MYICSDVYISVWVYVWLYICMGVYVRMVIWMGVCMYNDLCRGLRRMLGVMFKSIIYFFWVLVFF